MDKFTTLEGVAAPLKIINVDTDMIIPKQYLKTIKRTGLGKGLFSEQRYKDDGSENPDFILNKPACRNSKGLVDGASTKGGGRREPGFTPQKAGLPQFQGAGRRQQFRLRLEPRACAVGAA